MNDLVHLASRETDTRKGRRLENFTLGWNLTEAVVGIGAGVMAGSIALIGFGVDSIIESFSGASLLWRLQSHEADEKREQLALKLVGFQKLFAFDRLRISCFLDWLQCFLVSVSLCHGFNMPTFIASDRGFC